MCRGISTREKKFQQNGRETQVSKTESRRVEILNRADSFVIAFSNRACATRVSVLVLTIFATVEQPRAVGTIADNGHRSALATERAWSGTKRGTARLHVIGPTISHYKENENSQKTAYYIQETHQVGPFNSIVSHTHGAPPLVASTLPKR